MNDGIPISRTAIADAIGLHIQELHAEGRLRDGQPLLRIDNRENARDAPYQFDAAKGQLHRLGCKAIPAGSKSALYGIWTIGKEEEALACPRCTPMAKPDEKPDQTPAVRPGDREAPIDLLYGVLSVISQFGSVLRERGQEYRKSRAGTMLGAQIEQIYNGVNERERNILDMLASSLGGLATAFRELDEGLNGHNDQDAAPQAAKDPGAGRPSGQTP
jgi:hypothetical protein